MVGIYEIKNLVNGKVYIGQSICIESRIEAHKKRESNEHLKNAFKKYGLENFSFSVLRECDKSDLSFFEHFYIIANCSFDSRYGYNKTLGGEEYSLFTEESLQKISENVTRSLRTSQKFNEYQKTRTGKYFHSEKTKKKMSESAKNSWKNGRDTSNYKGGITEENRAEKCRKNALASKGKRTMNNGKKQIQVKPEDINLFLQNGYKLGCLPVSEETRRKMSESAKKRCKDRNMSTVSDKKIMNKDGVDKYFPKDEINTRLLEGWKLGRSTQ